MHTARVLAGMVAVAVVAACGPATTDPDGGGPGGADVPAGATDGPVPPGGTPTTAPDAPATGDAADGSADGAPQGDGAEGGDDGAAAGSLTPVDDLGPVGANGRAMLRGDRPRLVVEIDLQEGTSPSPGATDHLLATLARHVDKPGGIVLEGGNTFASDRTSWTAGDLRELAATHRTTRSTDDTVSLYVLYVRGGFVADGEETNAIGVTHRASEIALFPEKWGGIAGLLGGGRQLEAAVLVHELGHAFGLVELTYDSDHDRQDPEHRGHSANRDSVMFWAVETTLVGQVFNGPPPDTFDAADVDDLTALREGR